MKRESEFRIWNGIEMVYDITVGRFGVFYVNPERGDGLNPKDTASLTGNTTKYPEGTPLMEFTGKKVDGKKIFEGDILRTVNYFDTDNKPVYLHHKVVYDTERAVFNAINLSNENELLTINGNCFLYVALKTPLIEVIGNIYENPDLLQ